MGSTRLIESRSSPDTPNQLWRAFESAHPTVSGARVGSRWRISSTSFTRADFGIHSRALPRRVARTLPDMARRMRCRPYRGLAGPPHPSLFDSPVQLGKHPVHPKSRRSGQTKEDTPVRQRVRVKRAGARGSGQCRHRGNPLQSQRVSTAALKPSASTLSKATAAALLANH